MRLPVLLHAECTVMAAEMGFSNVGQWMERAASAQLAADREAVKAKRFRAARREAEADRCRSMPYPSDFGLPNDFDLPLYTPDPPSPLRPFRR